MNHSIYVTQRLPDAVMAELERQFAVVDVNPHDRPVTRDELMAGVTGRDAVVALLCDRIDAAVLDAAGPGLKIVANYAVGYNNIDLAAASERGIVVTNTPGVLDDATAGLAMALILAVARRVAEGDAYVRAGEWTTGWGPRLMVGLDVDGRTLGIAGLGRIGRNLARKARGFDMKLIYSGRSRHPEFEAETGARYVDKQTLLAESDFLSLHVPLTPETHHWIGAREFAAMKPTAVLINTARGPVVDEAAMVEALATRRIWGAGLDVFEDEPRLVPGLAELPNVVMLPHVGSATVGTREAMGRIVIDNLARVLAGQEPLTCVNPDVAPPRR